jgi:hypothetical protein
MNTHITHCSDFAIAKTDVDFVCSHTLAECTTFSIMNMLCSCLVFLVDVACGLYYSWESLQLHVFKAKSVYWK